MEESSNSATPIYHCGIGFLFVFIGFGSAANLVTQALDEDGYANLGLYSLGALYLSFAFCSLFLSTALVYKLGSKRSMVVGGLCYVLWMACSILPLAYKSQAQWYRLFVYGLFLITAVMNGFGASILWVGQGKYIKEFSPKED